MLSYRHSLARAILSIVAVMIAAMPLSLYAETLPRELPQACRTDCTQKYGIKLGQSHNGTSAYSNCNSSCVIFDSNTVDGVYTGIRWQCVEYARRWLLLNKGVVFGDVDIASDIWDSIGFYTRVSNNKKIPVETLSNGSSHAPERDDLLVYSQKLFGTGHVAVVVDVNLKSGMIELAEQNFSKPALVR